MRSRMNIAGAFLALLALATGQRAFLSGGSSRYCQPYHETLERAKQLWVELADKDGTEFFRQSKSLGDCLPIIVSHLYDVSLVVLADATRERALEELPSVTRVSPVTAREKMSQESQRLTERIDGAKRENETLTIEPMDDSLHLVNDTFFFDVGYALPLTASRDTVGRWISRLRNQLETALQCDAADSCCSSVDGVGVDILRVGVVAKSECIRLSTEHLIHDKYVRFIDPVAAAYVAITDASRVVQDGSAEPGSTPLWDRGINGSRNIIGIGDTGVSTQNCFFSQGKVKDYIEISGQADSNGHGTHVAGILAGNADHEQGIAKGAQLVVADLQSIQYARSGKLDIPDNLNREYLQLFVSNGAETISNSWTARSFTYDTNALQVDQFVHDHPRSVVAFAAGNRGGWSSVMSPALAKDALSVGATLSSKSAAAWPQQFESNSESFLEMEELEGLPFIERIAMFREPKSGQFNLNARHTIALAAPREGGCIPQHFDDGNLVVVKKSQLDQSGCPVNEYAGAVQDGRAPAGIVVILDTQVCGVDRVLPEESEISIPLGAIPNKEGKSIIRALQRNVSVSGRVKRRDIAGGEPWERVLASFSSKGPTGDRRIKPDLVAPGDNIASALLGFPCELAAMSGTSMATPLVAGGISLAREKLESNGFSPSGALLKALLVAGADDINGFVDDSSSQEGQASRSGPFPMENSPSCEQGFGRMNLEQSLAMEGMLTYDEHMLEASGEQWWRCLRVKDEFEAITASLVYDDPPGDRSAPKSIINKLHLALSSSNGTWGESTAFYYPFDSNVQRLRLKEKQAKQDELVVVQVDAERIQAFASPQPFSVVILGRGVEQVEKDQCGREALLPVDFDYASPDLPPPPPPLPPPTGGESDDSNGSWRVASWLPWLLVLIALALPAFHNEFSL